MPGGLILSSLPGPIGLLFYVYMAHRYFHEYILFFCLVGGLGMLGLWENTGKPRIQWLVLALMITNIMMNLIFSIQYQMNDTNMGPALPQMLEKAKAFESFLKEAFCF